MEIKKAIFLRKDGILIPDIPYNVNPDLIALSAGIVSGLKKLMKAGYQLIVVSSQVRLEKDFFQADDLIGVEKRIDALLRRYDIYLSGFYYCPHYPDGKILELQGQCKCRKPKATLLLAAAEAHRIDISKSWLLGNVLNDIETGNRVGCKTILINNGNEMAWKMSNTRTPDCILSTVDEAADYILNVPLNIKVEPQHCLEMILS